jgi:hypothetical protein
VHDYAVAHSLSTTDFRLVLHCPSCQKETRLALLHV